MTLCSSGLEVLVPEGEMLLLGDKRKMLLKFKTAFWTLQIPHVSESINMEGSYSFGVTDPDYQGEIGLPFHS